MYEDKLVFMMNFRYQNQDLCKAGCIIFVCLRHFLLNGKVSPYLTSTVAAFLLSGPGSHSMLTLTMLLTAPVLLALSTPTTV